MTLAAQTPAQPPTPEPPSSPPQPAPQASTHPSSAPPPAPFRASPPTAKVLPGHALLHSVQSLLYIVVTALFIITFTAQPFRIPSESMEPTLLVGDFLLVDKEIAAAPAPGHVLPAGTIHRGDVIVFHYPSNPLSRAPSDLPSEAPRHPSTRQPPSETSSATPSETPSTTPSETSSPSPSTDPGLYLVKRVIGLPGDHLRLHNGRAFIDDRPLDEPYAVFSPSGPDPYRDEFPQLSSADPTVQSAWWIQMRALVSHGELTIPPDLYFVLGDNRNDSEDSRYWGLVPRAAIVGKPFLVYFSLRTPHPAGPADLTQPTGALHSLLSFARWDRALHIIR